MDDYERFGVPAPPWRDYYLAPLITVVPGERTCLVCGSTFTPKEKYCQLCVNADHNTWDGTGPPSVETVSYLEEGVWRYTV